MIRGLNVVAERCVFMFVGERLNPPGWETNRPEEELPVTQLTAGLFAALGGGGREPNTT